MVPEKYENLINFILLHSYALTKPGLLYGKSGTALCLFESSRFLEYEKLEEYGLELLQEAMASELHDYSFQNGKAGIAWVVNYLIENQFIDANLNELYGDEIKDIISHIKSIDKMQASINDCIGFLAFIYMMEEHISNLDFDFMCQLLIPILTVYFAEFPISSINCDLFYRYASVILGLDNGIDKKNNSYLSPVVNSIINRSDEIFMDYVCNSLPYATNLYIYGMKKKDKKAICISEYILDIITKNTLKETLTFQQLIEFSYFPSQLSAFGKNVDLFYNLCVWADSCIYNMNEKSREKLWPDLKLNKLMSIEAGIPRFLWINSIKNAEKKDFNKEILLLF